MKKDSRLQREQPQLKKRMIPDYAIFPLAVVLAVGIFTFFITRLWTDGMVHYDLTIGLDEMIPFVPIFILPYFLAYFQWMIGFLLIARTDRLFCRRILYGDAIAKLLAGAVFCLLPTTMVRADITGTDIFSKMVAFLYQVDAPVNLFPSLHCLDSWICFRFTLNRTFFENKYSIAMGIFTVLVFLSTLFVKQHVCVDVFAGIAVAEIGLFVSRKIFDRLDEASQ